MNGFFIQNRYQILHRRENYTLTPSCHCEQQARLLPLYKAQCLLHSASQPFSRTILRSTANNASHRPLVLSVSTALFRRLRTYVHGQNCNNIYLRLLAVPKQPTGCFQRFDSIHCCSRNQFRGRVENTADCWFSQIF